MPGKDRLPKQEREELANLLHQEIWETLPVDLAARLRDKIFKLAEERGIPLYNPVSMKEAGDNKVMMQYFEWYLPDDGRHWVRLMEDAEHLRQIGVGGVWLPPFCKATGTNDTGYGIYDLFDMGEFEQKGSRRTKYGTKEELKAAIDSLHEKGIQVYSDTVLNHKAGADETEVFKIVEVSPDNREQTLSAPYDIEGWTKFTFPGRGGMYSEFQWNFQHFNGLNYDQRTGNTKIFRILGENKDFSDNVSGEFGNFDYLMFANIDYRNRDVIDETLRWGEWVIEEMNLDGMRLDAIKHIDANFMEVFVRHLRLTADKPLYFVGEYWNPDEGALSAYLQDTEGLLALFDVALHYRFVRASHQGRDYDLRTIFDNTFISRHVLNAAIFVDNHDSQPGQALESWVQDWFKPLAYALILLRQDGYPCVFYGDYYGTGGPNSVPGKREVLDRLLEARQKSAYGEQVDYFDHANTIGWVRLGDAAHEGSGLACVMSNGEDGYKRMCLGGLNGGTLWHDAMGAIENAVTLDEGGWADFYCKGGSVSVYTRA